MNMNPNRNIRYTSEAKFLRHFTKDFKELL